MMDWILSSINSGLNAIFMPVIMGLLYLQFHLLEAIRNNPFIILYFLVAWFYWKLLVAPLLRIVKWLFNLWRKRSGDENY